MLMNMVYDNLVKGKKSQWLCNADLKHTMGYTPELAAGTARLGNTPDAFNQVWNLPVDNEALTGRQWAKLFADKMGGSDKVQVLPGWGIKLMGFFVPILGEIYEMRYQYDREYFFDSSKFNKHFNYRPITNADAVLQTINSLKSAQ
jgi:nucleoside-diphosphate-sugar epimerase